jgi:hypothetical protein
MSKEHITPERSVTMSNLTITAVERTWVSAPLKPRPALTPPRGGL